MESQDVAQHERLQQGSCRRQYRHNRSGRAPGSPGTGTTAVLQPWAHFALYVALAFVIGGYLRHVRYVIAVAILVGAFAIGYEVYRLYFPVPREFKDFRTLNVIAAWLGALTGAVWAGYIIRLRDGARVTEGS